MNEACSLYPSKLYTSYVFSFDFQTCGNSSTCDANEGDVSHSTAVPITSLRSSNFVRGAAHSAPSHAMAKLDLKNESVGACGDQKMVREGQQLSSSLSARSEEDSYSSDTSSQYDRDEPDGKMIFSVQGMSRVKRFVFY